MISLLYNNTMFISSSPLSPFEPTPIRSSNNSAAANMDISLSILPNNNTPTCNNSAAGQHYYSSSSSSSSSPQPLPPPIIISSQQDQDLDQGVTKHNTTFPISKQQPLFPPSYSTTTTTTTATGSCNDDNDGRGGVVRDSTLSFPTNDFFVNTTYYDQEVSDDIDEGIAEAFSSSCNNNNNNDDDVNVNANANANNTNDGTDYPDDNNDQGWQVKMNNIEGESETMYLLPHVS
jgi:hypothetical protein